MKTETNIAEERLELLELLTGDRRNPIITFCEIHKESCQRFLEKIKEDLEWANAYRLSLIKLVDFPDFLKASIEGFREDKENERSDKENAIKKYDKVGI